MSTRRELTIQTARKKGYIAVATGVGGLVVTSIAFSIGIVVGFIGLAGSAWLTWKKVQDWLKFRGEWGLRF